MESSLSRESPDTHAAGLLKTQPDALRYNWNEVFSAQDIGEVPGIVRDWMPEGCHVLDVGCATGSITLKVNGGKGNVVLGVEPDHARATLAQERGLDVVEGLLDEKLLIARGPFDVILFTDVLEHVPSPGELLHLAASGLREDGVIMASVPNVAHWTVRLKLLLGKFDYTDSGIMDATHLRWFTSKTLRSLFESQGLRVVGLSAAAGNWLPVYRKFPLKLLPVKLRRKAVQALTNTFPTLFGCQLVIKATRAPVAA